MGASVSVLDDSNLNDLFINLRSSYQASTDLDKSQIYSTIQNLFVTTLLQSGVDLNEEEACLLFEKRVRYEGFFNIEELDLSDARLRTLPVVTTVIANLQGLYLEKNELETLPGQITELQDLVDLYLRENVLIDIPFHINELPKLEGLYLDQNLLVLFHKVSNPFSNTFFINRLRIHFHQSSLLLSRG